MGRRRQAAVRTLWECPECGDLMWYSRTAGKRVVECIGCHGCGHYEKVEEIVERQMALAAAAFREGRVRDGPGRVDGCGEGDAG